MITLRPAKPNEAQAISDLAFRSKAVWGYDEAFMAACKAELTYSEAQLKSDEMHFEVALCDGQLAGFYALENLSASTIVLEALFVDPAMLGKGLGRSLLQHAKVTAASLGGNFLEAQSDPNAEPFYRAMGALDHGRLHSASIPGRTLPLVRFKLRE